MKKKLHTGISVFLLAVIMLVALPKVYIHEALGHVHHTAKQHSGEVTVEKDTETRDCSFEKLDTPIYFTVFKFILNVLPIRSAQDVSFSYKADSLQKLQYEQARLRGPPAA